jgi:hypothetical protein
MSITYLYSSQEEEIILVKMCIDSEVKKQYSDPFVSFGVNWCDNFCLLKLFQAAFNLSKQL